MEDERGKPEGWTCAESGPVGLESAGRAVSLVLVHDLTLTKKGLSIVTKPYWLHPLVVVGGGAPITRH